MTDIEATGGSHRLFFALWPPDHVRHALELAADDVAAFKGVSRRVAPEKLHLTLHFLGSLPARDAIVIDQATAAAATISTRAFELHVDHAGSFPGARVGWLAPAANQGLDALWLDLRNALDDRGVSHRSQPAFVPHVTTRRGIRERLPRIPIAPIPWDVASFVLVHSHDGRYDVLSEWPLQRA